MTVRNLEILIGFELLQEFIPVDDKVGFFLAALVLCWLIRKSRSHHKAQNDS